MLQPPPKKKRSRPYQNSHTKSDNDCKGPRCGVAAVASPKQGKERFSLNDAQTHVASSLDGLSTTSHACNMANIASRLTVHAANVPCAQVCPRLAGLLTGHSARGQTGGPHCSKAHSAPTLEPPHFRHSHESTSRNIVHMCAQDKRIRPPLHLLCPTQRCTRHRNLVLWPQARSRSEARSQTVATETTLGSDKRSLEYNFCGPRHRCHRDCRRSSADQRRDMTEATYNYEPHGRGTCPSCICEHVCISTPFFAQPIPLLPQFSERGVQRKHVLVHSSWPHGCGDGVRHYGPSR